MLFATRKITTLLTCIGASSVLGIGSVVNLGNGVNSVTSSITKSYGEFNGHFPGMGPYGPKGNQDRAFGYTEKTRYNDWKNFEFDISTTSEQYINDHYCKGRGDTPGYAIYDFLTDAYPKGAFTEALYAVKEHASPSINTVMKVALFYIGVQKDQPGLLKLNPIFFGYDTNHDDGHGREAPNGAVGSQ